MYIYSIKNIEFNKENVSKICYYKKMKNLLKIISSILFCSVIFSCKKYPEMTLEEIEAYKSSNGKQIISKTVNKPYKDQNFINGKPGGIWYSTISGDPKSFNYLIAERDGETAGILQQTNDYLVDFDMETKKWKSRLADFKIIQDKKNDTLDVIYTLKDNLYWSFYKDSKPKVKITSEDVIFWYNEIMGDENCSSSAYNSRFMEMKDGSIKEITIEKIDERSFVFHFPRTVAEPLLSTNMNFGPAFIYKKAKEEGGVEGVKELFSIAEDPKNLPSCGKFFLTEYVPGQRIVYERNPDYWEKDENGNSIVYPEKMICQIASDSNTNFLLFKQNKIESYSPTPEQLEDLVQKSNNLGEDGYTVFSDGGALSASFWTFNQNPKNKNQPYYEWFTKKEFRQAMSCLLNRQRIINQTYRGLAEAKYNFFPKANKFYNEEIVLQYRYSTDYAEKLLYSIGFKKDENGIMRDDKNQKIEFDLTIVSSNPVVSDIAQIITDECKKCGITINVRQTDFQKLVEMLTSTFDWQSLIIGLSGGTIFPTQGSNVWLSSGNLHMWNPLQKTPATQWEARIDFLYNEASCIVEEEKAKPLWDEYQKIILEQCPVIYLVSGKTFWAINNRWDLSNVYFDNVNGALTDRVFLK